MKPSLLAATLLVLVLLVPGLARGAGSPAAPAAPAAALGTGFTYQGRLEQNGQPVNGQCDLRFSLWDDPTAGAQVGAAQTLANQTVSGGLFTVVLNGSGEFGQTAFYGAARWLATEVRCPAGSGSYTLLNPRQPLTPAPFAHALRLPVRQEVPVHGIPLYLVNTITGQPGDVIYAQTDSNSGKAISGYASSLTGSTYGVRGQSASSTGTGVYALATSQTGTPNGLAAEVLSPDGVAVRASAIDGRAIYAFSSGSGTSRPTVDIVNFDPAGISLVADQTSTDSVVVLANRGTGDLIRAFSGTNAGDLEFRVTNNGNVYIDGGYHCGQNIDHGADGALSEAEIEPCLQDSTAADFAEMLPAVPGLSPGDVLAIGPDGRLALSTQAYQASLAGVYSTRPSYLGNSRHAGEAGYAPLAIAGIVPVKVSAENGPIAPGDLLTTAATPGHAMRAEPITVQGISFYPSGVILGKALEGLETGTGLINVLVTLQ